MAADSSGNVHSGTIVNSVTFNAVGALNGDADTAIKFNTGWITASVPALSTSYTLEAWVKVGWLPEQHLVDVSPQQLLIVGGQFKFGTGGDYLSSPLSTYGDNQYHHVAATYDGATKRLYVDGVLVASAADSGGKISSSALTIANFYGGGYNFTGTLDEVAIYGQALSATQISNHYSAGKTSSPSPSPSPSSNPSSYMTAVIGDSPAAYFRLDETGGTTVADSSGHSRTGAITGSVSFSATGALNGDPDTALKFNSGWIDASVPALGSSYTLEAWIKTGWLAEQHIIDMSPQQLLIEGGAIRFGTGGHYLSSPLQTYGDNQYHHLVASYDGTRKRLYVDGSLVASKVDSAAISGGNVTLGHFYGGGYNYTGTMDEVAVYGQVLSVAQIANHYSLAHGSATPPPSPSPSPSMLPSPSPSPSVAPSPSPSPVGSVLPHVLTADYAATNGGTNLAPAIIAPWLSWAETTWQANQGLETAGIKTMYYTNPNRQMAGDPMYTSDESTFAHTCSGSRIQSSYRPGEYLMDPNSTAMRNLWAGLIAQISVGVHWDAIFEDDANDVLYATGTPCNYTQASWLAASQGQIASVSPVPIMYNGLQIDGEMGLNAVANTAGGMYEGCYADSSTYPKIWDNPYWISMENTEIGMAQQNRLFICLARDGSPSASSADGRLYTYASFMLTYAASSSMLWEVYATPSHLNVNPETTLVPANPLVSTPNDISGLRLAAGVYGREYANCYIARVAVGACAAVVNPDRYNSHSYPYGTKYQHTLVLSGGGVLDGGSIATTGGAPPSTLNALEGVVVFQ